LWLALHLGQVLARQYRAVAAALLAASLSARQREPGLSQPPLRTCAAVAVACLGVSAARPAPLVLGIALVLLIGIPWVLAVARRLADEGDPLPS
jgi:hypothetical protein